MKFDTSTFNRNISVEIVLGGWLCEIYQIWNFSLAGNLAGLRLQDRPRSGSILSLSSTKEQLMF